MCVYLYIYIYIFFFFFPPVEALPGMLYKSSVLSVRGLTGRRWRSVAEDANLVLV